MQIHELAGFLYLNNDYKLKFESTQVFAYSITVASILYTKDSLELIPENKAKANYIIRPINSCKLEFYNNELYIQRLNEDLIFDCLGIFTLIEKLISIEKVYKSYIQSHNNLV